MPFDVISLGSRISAIAAGASHTCALTTGGGVKCWGQNGYGQPGDGKTTNQRAPANVSTLDTGVTAIAAGNAHTCALTGFGAQCWGYNFYGQVGNGVSAIGLLPVDVVGSPFLTPTTTLVTAQLPAITMVGQSYSVSVSVSTTSDTPTGSTTVSDDEGASCGPAVLSLGAASCSLASTVVGNRTLTATYTPSGNTYFGSSGKASHVVNLFCSLDIDGDTGALASTDGLLVMRHLLGLNDAALIEGAYNPAGLRATAALIGPFIQTMINNKVLDLDGDTLIQPQTDGVMLLRILLGFRGDALTNGAIGVGPPLTRPTWADIRNHLNPVCAA